MLIKYQFVPLGFSILGATVVFINKAVSDSKKISVKTKLTKLGAKLAEDSEYETIVEQEYFHIFNFLGRDYVATQGKPDFKKLSTEVKDKCLSLLEQEEIDDLKFDEIKNLCTKPRRPLRNRVNSLKKNFSNKPISQMLKSIAKDFDDYSSWVKRYGLIGNDFWNKESENFLNDWCIKSLRHKNEKTEKNYWKYCR